MLRILLVAFLIFLLNGCSLVSATDDYRAVFSEDFDYAARVLPDALITQVREENVSDKWMGDPKRFSSYKHSPMGSQTIYIISPNIHCPDEEACPTFSTTSPLYKPTCGSGGCHYTIYVEEGRNKYRQVFAQLLNFQVKRGTQIPIFKIDNQYREGLPTCFELQGFDGELKFAHQRLRALGDGDIISRYCYNGRRYVLDNVRAVEKYYP